MEISNPEDYKVALYIRLSKEDDKEVESQSITNQRSLLLSFVMEQRLEVYDIYIDDGFSGTSFDRPAFNRMIKDIEKKKINMVITKDMSRLGRDYIQTGYYMEKYFPEGKVRYISLLDGIDTGVDSYINDITPFKAIMNDMYAKDISKKIKSVKQYKQKKGLFIGGKASYGYKLSTERKNSIVIDEEAAEIVKKIFQLSIKGKSCREIAIILNNEKVLPPSTYANLNLSKKGPYSGKWSSERITFMLKNQVYIGNMVQGRTKKVNYKSKKSIKIAPKDWTIVENTHKAIIDREVFDKVQLLVESRKKTRSRTYDYLLKGLIYCKECGYPLGVINRTLAENRNELYFVCRTYQRFTKANKCTCHCAKVNTITNQVLSNVAKICEKAINKDDFCEVARDLYKKLEEQNNNEGDLKNLLSQINSMTVRLDKIYGDKLSGLLDETDFQRVYVQTKEKREKLHKKVENIQNVITTGTLKDTEVDKLLEKFLKINELSKELIVSLISRIELTKEKEIHIFYRFKKV